MRTALLALLVCTPAFAQTPADSNQIQHVITAQIDAFRRDDGQAAFAFAAPVIQSQFGDSEHFIAAVRQAYQPVYRPRSFSFGTLATKDGKTTQLVEVIGPDGRGATAVYSMEHEADGTWRISGCELLKSELQET